MKTFRHSIAMRVGTIGLLLALASACGGGSRKTTEPGVLALSSLTVTPSNVPLGVTATGRVTLTRASSGTTVVALSASDASVTVPASVAIGNGSSAADFSITTVSVGTPIITASLQGDTKTAGLNVVASSVPILSSITTASGTIVGGTTVQGTATLTLPATAGGAVVMLSSNRTQATVPASVTIPAGATSANFTITTTAVTTSTTATITGTYAGVMQTANLTLTPPGLAASLTVRSIPPPSPAVTNSCPLAPSGTALTCTFDGSASTGSISSYKWSYVIPASTSPTTLTQTTATPTLSNPPVTCGFFTGVSTTSGTIINMTVTLVVVDSTGTSSSPATNSNVFITPPSGTCGF
jgi:hypothetical protein